MFRSAVFMSFLRNPGALNPRNREKSANFEVSPGGLELLKSFGILLSLNCSLPHFKPDKGFRFKQQSGISVNFTKQLRCLFSGSVDFDHSLVGSPADLNAKSHRYYGLIEKINEIQLALLIDLNLPDETSLNPLSGSQVG